jgi:CRP-like cAMP-binding protein
MFVDGGEVDKEFFLEDETVFQEGDPGAAAYIVESGSVAISSPSKAKMSSWRL